MTKNRTLHLAIACTPLVFAVLSLFHPAADPWELNGAVDAWMLVHAGQLPLTLLLGYACWSMFDDIEGRSATVVRATLPVFLIAFSAFDAVAGLATGWLAKQADGESGPDRVATLRAVEDLFATNWLAGNLSILGAITALSWATIAVAGTLALRGAGADRLTVIAMGASVLFASHPPPLGTIGLLGLGVAAIRWQRRYTKHPLAERGRERDEAPVAATAIHSSSREGVSS